MWKGEVKFAWSPICCSWAPVAHNQSKQAVNRGCGKPGGRTGTGEWLHGPGSVIGVYVQPTLCQVRNLSELSTFGLTFPQHFPSYPQIPGVD